MESVAGVAMQAGAEAAGRLAGACAVRRIQDGLYQAFGTVVGVGGGETRACVACAEQADQVVEAAGELSSMPRSTNSQSDVIGFELSIAIDLTTGWRTRASFLIFRGNCRGSVLVVAFRRRGPRVRQSA